MCTRPPQGIKERVNATVHADVLGDGERSGGRQPRQSGHAQGEACRVLAQQRGFVDLHPQSSAKGSGRPSASVSLTYHLALALGSAADEHPVAAM
jgi:hypothetical protein